MEQVLDLIEKSAVLHVHTTASDGSGSVEDVIQAAADADIDILGINDHDSLLARDEGFGGWQSNLFVLAGAELEDSCENNHLLVYGIDELPRTDDTDEQIRFVNRHGGIAIAAHPRERAGKLPGTRSYCWKGDAPKGLSGVEVWNYMSSWKAGISLTNAPLKLLAPDRSVDHPDKGAVEFWLAAGGAAIACPDAHAFRYGTGRFAFEVFPYAKLFRRLRTHILLEQELDDTDTRAEKELLDSLRRGSCFISNRLLGDAAGFRAFHAHGTLSVSLPDGGELYIHSGRRDIRLGFYPAGVHEIETGECSPVYVTVLRRGRTWIFSGLFC